MVTKEHIEAAKYLITQLPMQQILNLTEAAQLQQFRVQAKQEIDNEKSQLENIKKQIKKTYDMVEKEREDTSKKTTEVLEREQEVERLTKLLEYREQGIITREEILNTLKSQLDEKETEINAKLDSFGSREKEIEQKEQEAEKGFKAIQVKIEEEYKEKLEVLKSNIQDEENKLDYVEKAIEEKENENLNFLGKLSERENELKSLEDTLNFKEREIKEKELEISTKIETERNELIKEIESKREEILKEAKAETESLKNKADELKVEISTLESEIQEKEEVAINKVETLANELKASKLEEVETEIASLRKEKLNEIEVELKTLRDEQNNIFKERHKELSEKEIEYREREEVLIQREFEAENGFREKNEEALKALKDREVEIKLEIQNLLKEKETIKLQVQDEIAEFRKLKEKNIEKELEDYKNSSIELINKTKNDTNIWRDEEVSKVDVIKQELESTKNSLEEKEKELNSKERKLDKLQKKIEERQEDLDDDEDDLKDNKNRFEEKVREAAGVNLLEKDNEIAGLNSQIEDLRNALAKSQDETNRYKLIHSKSGERTSEELLIEIKNLSERNAELEMNLAKRPNSDRVIELESKLEALKNAKDERDKLLTEVEVLREDNNTKYILESELENKKLALETIESNIETLRLEKIALDEEVSKFKKLYDQVDKIEARVEAIEKPRFEELPEPMESDTITEKEWLDRILNDCKKSGFVFSKRLLYAFHTALKTANWSIVTVLLGVSGTGKSKLPELYARFGGMYFELLSVGPDWQDEIPLFGYYNSIDNRYNATELLRAMVQFSGKSKVNDLSDYMYLVLLDEMNLAHVEEYFKDMLSKLEAKRGKKSNEEVVINIDQGAGAEKYKLPLTNNILWLGTMNEDETTKSLSDKVIDRGQLISFPKPNKFASIELTDGETTTFAPANKKLKKSIWEKWQKRNVLGHEYFRKQKESYKEALERINALLEKSGITLGHRVWQSIEGYMAYHVEVTDLMLDENGCDISMDKLEKAKVDKSLTEAFEEAIVHKVMPKLRGIANSGNTRTEVIDGIRTILIDEDFAPGLLRDFDFATREENEVFLWKSASYLEVQSEEVTV